MAGANCDALPRIGDTRCGGGGERIRQAESPISAACVDIAGDIVVAGAKTGIFSAAMCIVIAETDNCADVADTLGVVVAVVTAGRRLGGRGGRQGAATATVAGDVAAAVFRNAFTCDAFKALSSTCRNVLVAGACSALSVTIAADTVSPSFRRSAVVSEGGGVEGSGGGVNGVSIAVDGRGGGMPVVFVLQISDMRDSVGSLCGVVRCRSGDVFLVFGL